MSEEYRLPESTPFFLVSNNGRVMVADTMVPARIADNGNGYKQVQIMRKGKRYTRYVHRLVAECFIPNPDNLPEINHKDGDKNNNSVDNLEWCNHSENLIHAYKTGLKANTTPKQQEAARKNVLKIREKCREGWIKWSKTPKAREVWLKNFDKADRWGTRNEPSEVKAERRREKKRLYYREHKEEFSRKAHERYMKKKLAL